jgi:tetratricopeptide (TPR) repeat protein
MPIWKALKWLAYTAVTGVFSLVSWFVIQATTSDSKSLVLAPLRHWAAGHKALAVALPAACLLVSGTTWLWADIHERLEALAGTAPLFVRPAMLRPVDFDLAGYAEYYQARPEVELARESLAEKGRVLIKGSPLAGKSRMAYELARTSKLCWVLRVASDFGDWKSLDIPHYPPLYKPSILWFIDDLDKSLGRTSLAEAERKLSAQANLQILITCRTGEEWKQVMADASMRAFCDTFPQISCGDFSPRELQELAARLGTTVQSGMYQGAPGSVTLGLDRMRERLAHVDTGIQRVMRAVYLLRQANIFKPSRGVLMAAAGDAYEPAATPEDLEPEITWLIDNGFLTRSGELVWPTHDVYATRDFFNYYAENSPTLKVHLTRLGEIFKKSKLADELHALGISFLLKQDYKTGLRWLEEAAVFAPNDERLYINIAVAYSGMDDHGGAVANLRRAAQIRPDLADTYLRLGYALKALGSPAEAIAAWREAVRLGSKDAFLHFNLGLLLTDAGEHKEAIGCLSEAVRQMPEDFRCHQALANALGENQQIQEAIVEYRAVLQYEPNLATVHNNLGNLLYKIGLVDDAFEEWHKAAALDARLIQPRVNMALTLEDKGQTEAAIEMFQSVLAIEPFAKAHVNLGRLWNTSGRTAQALEAFRAGVQLEPENFAYRVYLADLLSNQQLYDEAITQYRESIRLRSDVCATHYNLAQALRSAGRLEESLSEFLEATHVDPNDFDSQMNAGMVAQKIARYQQSVASYREAVRLRPEDAGAHYGLGITLYQLGQIDQALDECRKALELKSDFEMQDGIYNYGLMLIHEGRVLDAVAEYRRILTQKPNAPEANTGMGLALSGMHKDQEALPYLEKALLLKPDYGAGHHCYGLALAALGRKIEADLEFAEAVRLGYSPSPSRPYLIRDPSRSK